MDAHAVGVPRAGTSQQSYNYPNAAPERDVEDTTSVEKHPGDGILLYGTHKLWNSSLASENEYNFTKKGIGLVAEGEPDGSFDLNQKLSQYMT